MTPLDSIKPANDDVEVPIPADQQEINKALRCLRDYQEICNIPPLSEKENRALLDWVLKGGRLPEHLNLDAEWRQTNSGPAMSDNALKNYVEAQLHLLLAKTAIEGKNPPLEDVIGIAETFAMIALERIRLNPDNPELVIVEVINHVLLLLDRDPQIQN